MRHRHLARFIDLELEGDVIPESLLMRILYAASEMGFGLKLHSAYLASKSAVPLAIRCGSTSVANFRNITDDDIAMLAASSTIAVFKPGLLLQSGNAFPRSMLPDDLGWCHSGAGFQLPRRAEFQL